MNTGISTANFYPELVTEEAVELYGRSGFRMVETFLNTFYEMKEGYLKDLRALCDRNDVKVNSVHVMSIVMEPSLFDRQKRRREDFMNILRSTLKAARILGADIYTFHGPNQWMVDNIKEEHILECYRNIVDEADKAGVRLAQENVSTLASKDPKWLWKLKEATEGKIKFTLDIKQAHRAGIPVDEYLEVMGEDIVNVHMNDFNGSDVCMLPGKGTFDYRSFLRKLKSLNYRGNGIIEVYRENFRDIRDLEESRDYLQKITGEISE